MIADKIMGLYVKADREHETSIFHNHLNSRTKFQPFHSQTWPRNYQEMVQKASEFFNISNQ